MVVDFRTLVNFLFWLYYVCYLPKALMLIWQENFYFVYFGRQICLRERRRLKNFQTVFNLRKFDRTILVWLAQNYHSKKLRILTLMLFRVMLLVLIWHLNYTRDIFSHHSKNSELQSDGKDEVWLPIVGLHPWETPILSAKTTQLLQPTF